MFCISSSGINHKTFICQSCEWHRLSSIKGASWMSVREWILTACSILNRHYTVRKTDLVRPVRNVCLNIGLETLQQNSLGNNRFPHLHSLIPWEYLYVDNRIPSIQFGLVLFVHSVWMGVSFRDYNFLSLNRCPYTSGHSFLTCGKS